MLKILTFIAICFIATNAQKKSSDEKIKEPTKKAEKKANVRPAQDVTKTPVEPFEKATVELMAKQCVKFETEAGIIEFEMYPESAPESVRSFLNLAATGALDTTTFSRIVPNFVIQGGDLFTREKMTPELDKRARRTLPDEPSQIKHERGILSMARSDEPNSASTHFFILLSDASTLDGKFAAFGRVTNGMETVEAIHKMPVEGEKPVKPVRIMRAIVATCVVPAKP
jgi:cyclophilin family peptidyl-prolyl cis-trans isomerase